MIDVLPLRDHLGETRYELREVPILLHFDDSARVSLPSCLFVGDDQATSTYLVVEVVAERDLGSRKCTGQVWRPQSRSS